MDALLLLGPTGVGKTPLGEVLEARGLLGRACVHFDFGAALRDAAAEPAALPALDAEALAVIRRVLDEGTLLEDHEWPVAEALLAAFLDSRRPADDAWLVLNGLPRHVGQAERVAERHDVRVLVRLEASREVIHERIRGDAGGDRAGREDDHEAGVAARIERYLRRTRPLVDHHRAGGVPVLTFRVGPETRPDEVYDDLAGRLGGALDARP